MLCLTIALGGCNATDALYAIFIGPLIPAPTVDAGADQVVSEGAGVLLRVNKFTYDPVFANCQGIKATLGICELADAYSKRKVNAVVKYPVDQYDALQAKIDSTLPISGTLVAFDSTMNQCYIEG